MKFFYPAKKENLTHISRDGRVYQLDSFWKMYELYKELDKKYSKLIQITDEASINSKFLLTFHTRDFVESLLTGKNREALIESSGVFWQPWLPIVCYNEALATKSAVLNLINGDNLSILISDVGHHTTPFQAFGFGPINSLGTAIYDLKKQISKKKIVVLDLDVHMGNGFSFINGENIYTFDLWNKKLEKWPINDRNRHYRDFNVNNAKEYFEILQKTLIEIETLKPDIVIYYSGADVINTDRMGGIKGFDLRKFKEREGLVFKSLKKLSCKVLLSFGGGYINYKGKSVIKSKKKLIDAHLFSVESAIKNLA